MKFIDEVNIQVISGNGGNGAASFRREKFIEFGGPDGGNGGRGAHIYFEANENLNTLIHFRGKKVYQAPHGGNGRGSRMDGLSGQDIIIKVPVGTILFDQETNQVIADLETHEQKVLIAKGGRGGLGNNFFKSSTNQTPMHAQDGEEGSTLDLRLELKLIADFALVGLPNAGKSTLISSISQAKPKVADYPFTTLEPNLGVVKVGEEAFVVADIPGLIEHAADGKGLGIKFLKHIERTKAMVHLVDCSMLLDEFEAIESYSTVRAEILKYKDTLASKKEIVCLTKTDAMTNEEVEKFQKALEQHTDKKVLAISSSSHENLDVLKSIMLKIKKDLQDAK